MKIENKRKPLAVDNRTVQIGDDYALDYWTRELATTKNKLKTAVTEVGDDLSAIKKYLKR